MKRHKNRSKDCDWVKYSDVIVADYYCSMLAKDINPHIKIQMHLR